MATLTKEEPLTKTWQGLSAPKTICFWGKTHFGNSAGIAHDDGENFNGATIIALQLALLLGASKDSHSSRRCPSADGYLTSSRMGGKHPYLSECSRRSLQNFYRRNSDRIPICWKDTPEAIDEDNTNLPAGFYEYRDYDICYAQSKGYMTLYDCDVQPEGSKLPVCHMPCCRFSGGSMWYRTSTRAPDGTRCDDNKICLLGECV
uniref:Metalloprotease n=1 Tax=Amblyomma maculatum TaxID=34609 RepID=G3MLD0_AMBMU